VARRFRAIVIHHQPEALGELAELIGGLGAMVDTARSAVEGLNKIRSSPTQVIVVGHHPPEVDAVAILETSIGFAPDALRIALVSAPDQAV
jgi:CheY-like chemotaxis protein